MNAQLLSISNDLRSSIVSINPLSQPPKDPLSRLPKELFSKVLDFILPETGYLNHYRPDRLGICYTSKILSIKTIQPLLFTIRPEAINELVRKIKGDIKKLPQIIKKQFKELKISPKNFNLSKIAITAKALQTIVAYFPNLESLNLKDCELDDSHLRYIIQCKKLKQLILRENPNITSTAIQSLGKYLPELIKLDLSLCTITDNTVEKIVNDLEQLQELSLANCRQLTSSCLRRISQLTKLEELDLSDCTWLNDHAFQPLNSLKQLKSIDLSSTDISDKTIETLSNSRFPQLQKLYLANCRWITFAIFNILPNLPQLTKLDLHDYGFIENIKNNTLTQLLSLQQLEECDLPSPSICTEASLEFLTGLQKLTSLDISAQELTEIQMQQLTTLSRLKSLDIAACGMDDDWLHYLPCFQKLEVLNLAASNISNNGLKVLTQLPRLQKLDLSESGSFTADALIVLSQLSTLSTLNLSDCQNLDREGYTRLHHLQILPNLIKLKIYGWKTTQRTNYLNYYSSELLNNTLNDIDNAIHDPYLSCEIVKLKKELPSLEIEIDAKIALKSTVEKIWGFLLASGHLLLDLLLPIRQLSCSLLSFFFE